MSREPPSDLDRVKNGLRLDEYLVYFLQRVPGCFGVEEVDGDGRDEVHHREDDEVSLADVCKGDRTDLGNEKAGLGDC